MKRVILIAALALTAVAVPTASAQDQVCPSLDTGHISGGNQTSITITAPAGQLIGSYCVKAGSGQQGEGPETTTVSPPASSVTISHSSGKEISHYSVDYVDATTTTTTPAQPGQGGQGGQGGQAGQQGAADQGSAGAAQGGEAARDQLAFTGLDTLWLALFGGVMVASGLALRARSRSSA